MICSPAQNEQAQRFRKERKIKDKLDDASHRTAPHRVARQCLGIILMTQSSLTRVKVDLRAGPTCSFRSLRRIVGNDTIECLTEIECHADDLISFTLLSR